MGVLCGDTVSHGKASTQGCPSNVCSLLPKRALGGYSTALIRSEAQLTCSDSTTGRIKQGGRFLGEGGRGGPGNKQMASSEAQASAGHLILLMF